MSRDPMRPFSELTPRGRIVRLRAAALDALRSYDVEVREMSFVSTGFNTVFRIDARGGAVYALRVSPSVRIHADGCEVAEAAWVTALHDAGLAVANVVPARDGSPVVWVEGAGVPQPRSCVLFEWVGGRPLRARMRVDAVRRAGALTARTHLHAAGYTPEPPAGVIVADRVLSFRVPDHLDELRPEYGSAVADAVERAQEVVDDLWRDAPHPPHLLHGDVSPGNVMVRRSEVVLIDFQDLIWGFEIQDAVIALCAFEHHAQDPAPLDAFRAGYEEVRIWPGGNPETVAALRAARHLNVLNYGMSMRGAGMEAFIARHAGPVAAWMRGRVR